MICSYSVLQSVSHALYHLAERPELLKPLREEIESLIKEEGWTKNSMAKMWKLDSFLRESQRHNGVNISMCLWLLSTAPDV